jgi:hypothetical protein
MGIIYTKARRNVPEYLNFQQLNCDNPKPGLCPILCVLCRCQCVSSVISHCVTAVSTSRDIASALAPDNSRSATNSPDIMTVNIGCLATKLNNIQNYFLTYYHKIIAYEREKCAYRILVVKPKEKRPLGRFRSRWEDNTKMD